MPQIIRLSLYTDNKKHSLENAWLQVGMALIELCTILNHTLKDKYFCELQATC